MSNTPSLRDLQLWLKWVITDPRGVTEALDDPKPKAGRYGSRYTEPTPSYLGFIVNDSTHSADRLDIYAEGYFSRILDCMAKDFSRTKKVVGEGAFTKLVADYLKAFPSRFSSIDEVGSQFTNFISEYDEISLQEWISDLALFEWSWIESFYAKEVEIKPDWRNELAKNPQARLRVHPSIRLINSHWPIGKLIRDLDSDQSIGPGDFTKESQSGIAIYRFNDEVHWIDSDLSVFRILQNLKNGTPFEEALSQAQGIDPQIISESFSHWVEREILCGVLNEKSEVRI